MTETADARDADRALKAKHRTMWALGDYSAVAKEVVGALGPVLVEACGVKRGDRVLDIAAGSGNAAIPAALAGGDVIASDLTPELMDVGQREAAARGAELRWQEADAEALPFADGAFDTVMSCVGVMFAPHHQDTADELLRVCRPGGTIGLISWTPEGFIGHMFTTMKPYAPPPPPGAQPPPLWGGRNTSVSSSVTVSRGSRRDGRRSAWTASRSPRTSARSSRPPTGRRSRSTGTSPTIPRRPPPWTGPSTNWRAARSRTG